MLPRRLLSWLIILTLLFGQAAAFAHVLSHLDPHESGLPDKVCEVCVGQASLGSAAPATVFSLPVEPGRYTGLPTVAQPPTSVPLHHAQARAPPHAI